jgi:hypothetical protein
MSLKEDDVFVVLYSKRPFEQSKKKDKKWMMVGGSSSVPILSLLRVGVVAAWPLRRARLEFLGNITEPSSVCLGLPDFSLLVALGDGKLAASFHGDSFMGCDVGEVLEFLLVDGDTSFGEDFTSEAAVVMETPSVVTGGRIVEEHWVLVDHRVGGLISGEAGHRGNEQEILMDYNGFCRFW